MKKIIQNFICMMLLITFAGSSIFTPAYAVENTQSQIDLVEVEDKIYKELLSKIDSNKYVIENVKAVYVSKEYIEELQYNSQSNKYFGYTISELEEVFNDKKYVFTIEDGKTIVKEVEAYNDNLDKIIKNVAIGGGVILVCVTVTAITSTTAPAVSAIFAMSAKGATIVSLSNAAFDGVISSVFTMVQTNDVKKSLEVGAVNASEGFKIGAILGAIAGGTSEALKLRGLTLKGLSYDEAAIIQKESKWSVETIKNLHSIDEFKLYKQANLFEKNIGNERALIRNLPFTEANLERMRKGMAPLDETGVAFELHHIGQSNESPLAILTRAEHILNGNKNILHVNGIEGVDHASEWGKRARDFWKKIALLKDSGGIQ